MQPLVPQTVLEKPLNYATSLKLLKLNTQGNSLVTQLQAADRLCWTAACTLLCLNDESDAVILIQRKKMCYQDAGNCDKGWSWLKAFCFTTNSLFLYLQQKTSMDFGNDQSLIPSSCYTTWKGLLLQTLFSCLGGFLHSVWRVWAHWLFEAILNHSVCTM